MATQFEDTPLTLGEFAEYADPPLTERQLYMIVAHLPNFTPVGRRKQHGKGRPTSVYSAVDLMRLHAALADWL
jgi:hypothetical protein